MDKQTAQNKAIHAQVKKPSVSKVDMAFTQHTRGLNDKEVASGLDKYFKQRAKRRN